MPALKQYKKYKPVQLNFTDKIPEGWIVKRGKFFFRDINERSKNGLEQLLSVSEHKGVVPRDSITVNMFQAASYEGYKLCKKGDIVINSLWAWHRGIGVSEHEGIVSTAYSVLRPIKPKQWNHRYLNYLLRTSAYVGENLIRSKGIWDSRLQLTGSNFLDIPILQPPIEVQNAIVEYLDKKNEAIEKFISNKERLIELLEERKKKVISIYISQWTHTELKYSGVDWIGNIPKNWSVLNLKYLLKSKLKYGANEEAKDANPEEPRYIRITDFGYDGKLCDDTFRSLPLRKAKEYLLTEGDILFARSGATVGKTFQFKDYNGLACFAGYLIKASPNEKKILSDFLYLYTQSSLFEEWKNRIFDKATIENIGADKYAVLKVIVPPIFEQGRIIEVVAKEGSEIDLAISKAQREIEAIKEYQESLIASAVTGKINVTENQLQLT